jgi:hypothetical protein
MIKPIDLHDRLEALGIPIFGVSSTGRIDFKPEATPEQIAQAQTFLEGYDQAAVDQQQNALKTAVLTTAQSAVGVALNNLTNVQVRALLAIVLFKEGAVATDGTIKPLNEWVR